MRRIAPAVLPALASAALAASVARADTQLLAGKRLALRQSAKSESLTLVSHDHLVAPLPGGSDDPTRLGAVLEIGNPGTGEWARFAIPAAGWSLNALGTVFRYEGRRPLSAGAMRQLVIRHGKQLKVRATAVGLSLDETSQGGLAVLLTTGSRRYCLLFGGASVKRDRPRRFAARNAPAPTACPTPLQATGTTSTSVPAAASTSTTRTTRTTTTSTTRTTQPPASTSTSISTSSTRLSTTVTTPSTSSTSSTRAPTTTTTTTSVPPTSSTSTSTSTSSSTSSSASTSVTSTSTSSTTTTTGYTCGGSLFVCGGTCPPPAKCKGGFLKPCRCEVVD